MSIYGTAIETSKRVSVGREHTYNIEGNGQSLKLNVEVVWCVLNRSVENKQGDVIPIYRAGIRFKNVLDKKKRKFLHSSYGDRIL